MQFIIFTEMSKDQKNSHQGGKAGNVSSLGFSSEGIKANSPAAGMMRDNAVRGELVKGGIVPQLQAHGAKKPF